MGATAAKRTAARTKWKKRTTRDELVAWNPLGAIKSGGALDHLQKLLNELALKPALFIGKADLQAVRHYIDGYCAAVQGLTGGVTPLPGWQHWVEGTFTISDPRWSWVKILKHQCGSDIEAIRALPSLLSAYRTHVAEHDSSDLAQWARRRVFKKWNANHHCPDDEVTGASG